MRLVAGFAPYLGWSQIDEGADMVLEFDCDITPRSKRYSGLLAASYLGAEATGTLTVYVNGEKIKSVHRACDYTSSRRISGAFG